MPTIPLPEMCFGWCSHVPKVAEIQNFLRASSAVFPGNLQAKLGFSPGPAEVWANPSHHDGRIRNADSVTLFAALACEVLGPVSQERAPNGGIKIAGAENTHTYTHTPYHTSFNTHNVPRKLKKELSSRNERRWPAGPRYPFTLPNSYLSIFSHSFLYDSSSHFILIFRYLLLAH